MKTDHRFLMHVYGRLHFLWTHLHTYESAKKALEIDIGYYRGDCKKVSLSLVYEKALEVLEEMHKSGEWV